MSENANASASSDMVEVTDSLEAIAVFRSWKNVFLTILVACLLIVQAGFWLIDQGIIAPEAGGLDASAMTPSESPTADVNETQTAVASMDDPNATPDHSALSFLKINPKAFDLAALTKTINVANGLMLLSGILFCLTLLFSMTITIIGRLGGIRHVCRAFFMSLIMLVLLLPWHVFFDSLACGYLYRPENLVQACQERSSDLLPMILHYLRYCGLWLLVCAFLMVAQVRCRRWAHSIRRRLQII